MERLQQVNITVYSDADCQSIHYNTVHDTNICAGVPEGGKGQCSVSTSDLNINSSLQQTAQYWSLLLYAVVVFLRIAV
jgi:hypothetical protein